MLLATASTELDVSVEEDLPVVVRSGTNGCVFVELKEGFKYIFGSLL